MDANNPPTRDRGPMMLDFDMASEGRWLDDGGQVESRKEEPLISALHYPLYLIANDKGVLVANSAGRDCVMLFHHKETAERHIAEATVIERLHPLYPLAIPNADAFRQGLKSLPADISCAIWDATVVPSAFVYTDLDELFLALDDG
jgi:hypothetical protein